MSWIDRIENTQFTITTGDGKVFTPLWKNGETTKDFNATIFDLIGQDGSLVDRRKVRARSFPLIFWFTGDDNIDQSDDFDQSANDPRTWTVRHPFYGDIIGQPLKISRNDNFYNCTEFNVDFWESLTGKSPLSNVSITDVMEGRVTQMATISPSNYGSKVTIKPADVNTVTDAVTQINLKISAILDDSNYSSYQLAKNSMFAAVDNLISAPVTAMQGIHSVIQLPALFAVSLKTRLSLLQALYTDARNVPGVIAEGVVDIINSVTVRNNKAYYESVGAGILMACANAMVNPQDGDYITRSDIKNASDTLSNLYNDYLQVLDDAYIAITDTANSFSASNETQTLLRSAIVDTIANLSALALNAKQERSVRLDNDSNLIVLTHKYMGLDAEDVNLETFRQINNIKNKKLFNVPKGTLIKYYA